VLIFAFCFGFELFLLFSLFCHFSCFLLAFVVFHLLDDFFQLFVDFCLLAVLHRVLDSNFKFVPFVINGLIKGGQFLGLIVMSH
jgi:hypothetical protein